MKRIIIAAVLGAVIAYVWGVVSWMVLPWHSATMHNLPNEKLVVEQLRNGGLESGVYQIPAMPDDYFSN